MNIIKRQSIQVIIISLMIGAILFGLAEAVTFLKTDTFADLDIDERKAIKLVLKNDKVEDFVNNYPNWWASAYADNATQWHVDFYHSSEYADEQWIGHAHIDFETSQVFDTFLPKEPSPEEFKTTKTAIEKLVFADAEVIARLGDSSYWEHDVYYDKYQNIWTIQFWQGISSLAIEFDSYQDDGKSIFEIVKIYDPEAFEGEEALQVKRDQAVELAYESNQIDVALHGIEEWHTYVEQQGESIFAVSFANSKDTLFYARVNVDDWEILSEVIAKKEQ